MYISRARLRADAPRRNAYWNLAGNGYRAHELVWSLFSDDPDRDRDFIFRWDTDGARPRLYTVSERSPKNREGLFRLEVKPYEPTLKAGQRLAFQVRVNPVIKKRDEHGRQRVHDVVMNTKWEMRQAGEWEDCELTEAQLVQREGVKWLAKRADLYGYDLHEPSMLATNHRKHAFRKPRNGRRVTFTTMDLSGHLTVTDPEAIGQMLYEGIGPSKAYGCGLMLVRPA